MAAESHETLARSLGWFSLALGATQIVAPRAVAAVTGTRGHRLLPLIGMREIAAGVGILSQRKPVGPMLWRVAGDALDLALLSPALRRGNPARGRTAFAFAAVAGVLVVDWINAQQLRQSRRALTRQFTNDGQLVLQHTLAINRSPEECGRAWTTMGRLPRFARSAGAPTFDAAPSGRGTLMRVRVKFRPPGGELAARLGVLAGGAPEHQLREAMRAFKQRLEAGEMPTTHGQSSGPRSALAKLTREGRES